MQTNNAININNIKIDPIIIVNVLLQFSSSIKAMIKLNQIQSEKEEKYKKLQSKQFSKFNHVRARSV